MNAKPGHRAARVAVAAIVAVLSTPVLGFSCVPTDTYECRLDLSRLTIVFGSGVNNYQSDGQLNGLDGWVAFDSTFPTLTPVDESGGLRAGFQFVPVLAGQVGGSGWSGTHEAMAFLRFDQLAFVPRPGWRVDAVEFSTRGERGSAGNGSVALGLPGAPVFDGSGFSASGLFAPQTVTWQVWFSALAEYEEGDDGDAVSYGTAWASFSSFRLVAHLSPVPEAPALALWLGGAGLLALARVRRRGFVGRAGRD